MQISELLTEASALINAFKGDPDAVAMIKLLHKDGGVSANAPLEELDALQLINQVPNGRAMLIHGNTGWGVVFRTNPHQHGKVVLAVSRDRDVHVQTVYDSQAPGILTKVLGYIVAAYMVPSFNGNSYTRDLTRDKRERRYIDRGLSATATSRIRSAHIHDDPDKKLSSDKDLPERLWKPYAKQVFGEVRRRLRKLESTDTYRPEYFTDWRFTNEFFNELVRVAGDREASMESFIDSEIAAAWGDHVRNYGDTGTVLGDGDDQIFEVWKRSVLVAAGQLGVYYDPARGKMTANDLQLQKLLPMIADNIYEWFLEVFFTRVRKR